MQKIEIYKKVANIKTLEEAKDMYEEIEDRFGNLPQAVLNLLAVARLKVYGANYAIESISQKGDDIQLKIHSSENGNLDGQRLHALSALYDGRIKLIPGSQIVIQMKCKGLKPEDSIEILERFLVQYKEALKSKGELRHVAN
jgi:transcription-repair coupling factor (superfamily II helicase)